MTNDQPPADGQVAESVAEFLASFSYGSRTDLNFKFLKSLDDEAAKEFIRQLFDAVGTAYDTGQLDAIVESAVAAQIAGYTPNPDKRGKTILHDDGPFHRPTKPLNESRVGLLTTSGHFVNGDVPRPLVASSMPQDEPIDRIGDFIGSESTLSEIPSGTATDNLRVRHGGYDITSAAIDPNVCFPIDVLRTMESDGTIGSRAPTFFSFPGATAQGKLRKVAPSWVDRIRDEHVDVLLLVPV